MTIDKKILWRAVNAGVLVCIGLFCAGRFLGIASLRFSHVLAAFLALFLLTALEGMALRGRVLLLAGAAAVFLGVTMAAGGKNALLFIQSYCYWLTGASPQSVEWVKGYELVQSAVFALVCFLVQMVMEKDFRLKIVGVLAVTALLLYSLFARKEVSRMGAAFMICYVMMFYVEGTQVRWKKEKQKNIQTYMLWLLPFLAAYFVLLLVVKVPEKPYDWQFVKSVYSRLKDTFFQFSINYLHGNEEDYNLALSGFSEAGRLEGGSVENEREIMTIESRTGAPSYVYLIGKVYDTFDGRQWEEENRDAAKTRYFDAAETLCAAKFYDAKYYTDYVIKRDIIIHYRHFHSAFLFAPLKAAKIRQGYEELDFQESGGSLYFNRKSGYGMEYEVSFYQLNEGQEDFWQFVEALSIPSADAQEKSAAVSMTEELAADLAEITGTDAAVDDIREYRQGIADYYQENIILTDGVKAYLETITEGAETDVEKLKAIEAELSSFIYNRTPGELPETVRSSEDFLDYFLLESREGYCTYFATAFVLLARAEGLPARYVQGFCVPARSGEETMVYSDMAHAWPEVYFEGVGWIPFEPTPGYADRRYLSWGMKGSRTDAEGSLERQNARNGTDLEAMEEEKEAGRFTAPEKKIVSERLFRTLGLIAAWLLFAALVIIFLSRLFGRIRYRKMDLTAKFRADAERNLRILSLMGIRRGEEETLEEFKKRAKVLLEQKCELCFLQRYEDFLYGDKEIEQFMEAEEKREQEELAVVLKERKWWKYVWYWVFYKMQQD